MINMQIAKLTGVVEMDISRVGPQINQVEQRLNKLTGVPLLLKVRIDTGPLYRQMGKINSDLMKLGASFSFKTTVDVSQMQQAVALAKQYQAMMGKMAGPGAMGGGGPLYMPGGPFPGAMGGGMGMGAGGQFASGALSRAVGIPLFNPAFAGGALGAGAVAYAAKTAIGAESQMVDLRRLTGRSPEEIAAMEQNLQGIAGRTPGASRADAFTAANTAARMGIKDIEAFIEPLLQLSAVLPELDMGTLADNIARVMNVSGLAETQVENFGSALLQLANETTATVDTTLDILRRLSGGRAAGLNPAQLMSLAVGIQESGLRTESGASALDRILIGMGTPKGQATIASALGMDVGDFRRGFDANPLQSLQSMFSAIGAMPEGSGRLEFLADTLGFDNIRDLQLLGNLGGQADRLEGWRATAQGQLESPTALSEGTAMRADTASAALELMGVQIENLANALAKPSLSMIGDVAGGIGSLAAAVEGFNNMTINQGALKGFRPASLLTTGGVYGHAKTGFNFVKDTMTDMMRHSVFGSGMAPTLNLDNATVTAPEYVAPAMPEMMPNPMWEEWDARKRAKFAGPIFGAMQGLGGIGQSLAGGLGSAGAFVNQLSGLQPIGESALSTRFGSADDMIRAERIDNLSGETAERERQSAANLEAIKKILEDVKGQVLSLPAVLAGGGA